MTKPQPVKIVREVTAEHGQKFAEAWLAMSLDSEITGLCNVTGIMEWPQSDSFAQQNYIEIGHEIATRTLTAVKDAIAEAFVKEAEAVIERERRLPRVVVVWSDEPPKSRRK